MTIALRSFPARNIATVVAGIALVAAAVRGHPAASAQASPTARPDLIVVNARVYTVDNARPMASALAVRAGRIVFVGSDAEARALAGTATRMLDVHGQTVIPGMVDAHAHLSGLATSLRNVHLAGSRSYDEVISRVVERARTMKRGEWVQGRGWDQNLWPDKNFPTHEALSRATPDNPVVLSRVDGHALLANAMAMRLAGVTAATKDPDGGRILRLPNGDPSGVFVDNAQGLVRRSVPSLSDASLRDATIAAIAEVNRWGLIGVHDAGESRRTIEVFESLARENRFNLRTYVMVSDNASDIAYYTARGPKNALYAGRIWIRAIKTYADGALGSRGAALLAPYSDDPGNTGLLVSTPAHLEQVAETGLRTGFQVNTHRNRRPRQPDRARRVRGCIEKRAEGGPSLSNRARAGDLVRRHPALRETRRYSVNAGKPSDERYAVGRGTRRTATDSRRVRVAIAPQHRRSDS